jgi:hypothetical protein
MEVKKLAAARTWGSLSLLHGPSVMVFALSLAALGYLFTKAMNIEKLYIGTCCASLFILTHRRAIGLPCGLCRPIRVVEGAVYSEHNVKTVRPRKQIVYHKSRTTPKFVGSR